MKQRVCYHFYRMNKLLLLFCIFFLTTVSTVEAHPGRTDGSGGHTCRTNCESWGLGYGEYHYHGGGASSSGGSSGGSYVAPVQESVQTQEVVIIPTNTPIPTRVPTRIPTRIPTKPLTPTVTIALSLTTQPSPTSATLKKVRPVQSNVTPQKQQGFFNWLFNLFGFQ
jgi:hypothetical protein